MRKWTQAILATILLVPSTLLALQQTLTADSQSINLSNWQMTTNNDTVTLTGYAGKDKDVVIPLSGDIGTTNVKITKQALRQAATEADSQGGTLSTSTNDSSGTGLVADNSTDDNPSDTIVDYSGTFKDLTNITKIDLSQLKIEAHDGANGQDVTGVTSSSKGEDGQAGESIDVSSMFENCTALKEVDLSSFVGQGGNGGFGGGKGKGGFGFGGIIDPKLLPENLTGDDLRLYRAYTGTTDKTNMFFPIAVNELALTKKVGFAPDELKENVAALRATDSGKGEHLRDSELGNVSLSAKDETGNAVDLADVSKKVGKYTLTYTYNGKSIDTHLTVEGGSITTQDLTLGTGDAWKPADNFVSAENENQQPIPFDQLTVTGADQVDLSKAGTYTVSFSYQDVSKTLTADAKVNVIDIQTKSLVLDVGAPWQPYDALTSVTNVDQV
ncbi:bacterial Ig-like domain-containing protein, partial [Enterococcus hirae]